MNLEEISSKYESPIICVIGATSPLPGYDEDETRKLGYNLRKIVEKKGTLFTGGVPGVGFDFYRGVIDYCEERNEDDKFFILFPEGLSHPEDYSELSKRTKSGILRVEEAGKNMEERRTYVGKVADLLVLINGSMGTIDESLKALIFGKTILCHQNSGGAAEIIAKIKKGEIEPPPFDLDLNLIQLFNSGEDIEKYLSNSNTYKYKGEQK